MVSRLAIFSMLILILTLALTAAQPQPGPYVDTIYSPIIISDDEYMTALLTHDLDSGGVPRPADLPAIQAGGFTINKMTRIGQTFLMTNNRVWPMGIEYIYPDPDDYMTGHPDPAAVPYEDEAECFRKGLFRLVDKANIVSLYAPLMSSADDWLPPGQAAWVDPDSHTPTFNPGNWNDVWVEGVCETASAWLNKGGFTATGSTNPNYDSGIPYSAPKMRVDPRYGGDLEPIEYYTIGPVESPLGFEQALRTTHWWQLAGIPIDLMAGTWLGMVAKLVGGPLEDYDIMTGVGIVWGGTAPDILADFTRSIYLPLWNFVSMNYSMADYWAIEMMATLDINRATECAYEIQKILSAHEPYMPLLLWETFTVKTGPTPDQDGYIGIINAKGFGARSNYDEFGKMFGRADRVDGAGEESIRWGQGSYLDTLNPMMADTVGPMSSLKKMMYSSFKDI